jgi:gamma-glutamyl-gamma-aminobutyrate hydrolase PuuD
MALADDGIIEAVYADGERYMRAYQWHPERICNKDTNNRRIFDDFIASCEKEK